MFEQVVRRFVGVFARREHPLVLFLDDLQWLDTATLEMLRHLLLQDEAPYLFLVGAYRDNEVGPDHPLAVAVKAIRAAGAALTEVVLAPLGLTSVTTLVADTLHRSDVGPLSKLVHDRTAGNPFFTIQFLTALADDGLVAFDRDANQWTWDLTSIAARSFTEDALALVIMRITRLPKAARDALQMLACLGSAAATETLASVLDVTVPEVHAALVDAVDAGHVALRNDTYTFLHDRIQEAAYALIPESERAGEHLRIGRLLAGTHARGQA